MGSVIIPDNDLWIMLLSQLRYAMGRRSYMPSLTADMIERYISHLTFSQREQMLREIQFEIRIHDANAVDGLHGHLGGDRDVKVWRDLASYLEGLPRG
jgi:hypothetical protein